ncbi:unnamed protein product, partial [Prorocentrum cordatum]
EVPRGRVSTYGDVAKALGCPAHSRHVGRALGLLPEGAELRRRAVPWWRVVNGAGVIRTGGGDQQRLLEAEGVRLTAGRPARILCLAEARWEHADVVELDEG